ncbi:MAG TPA: class I SAM-dependent methyltransferase [Acidimicrobiia bacterium]|nr:class I SAM-dependent methyltransferase [Acidimicrobiia bacterium]
MNAAPAELVYEDGVRLPLALERWFGEPEAADRELVARTAPPVLDVGCGPGRHVLALAVAGIPALGLDVAPSAVRLARTRGACVLERSVFDRVPAAGRWGSALLLDGNAGIGGDPEGLFRRVGTLLRQGGRLLVEVKPPGVSGGPLRARIETATRSSPWFPWARVGADDLVHLAASSRLTTREVWHKASRWFGMLEACER